MNAIATASMDVIDAAIYSAINSLTIKQGGSALKYAGRWAGPPPQEDKIAVETFGATPSALLAWEQDTTNVDVETLAGDFLLKARTYWTVLVGLTDPRGATQVVKGSPGAVGGLSVLSSIIGAVNGLVVVNPAATITFLVTGTAGATTPLAGLFFTIGIFTYQPTVASVTLDASGNGYVDAACIGPPGGFGNYTPGTIGTWKGTPPAGFSDIVTVSVLRVVGIDVTLRNRRVHYAGARTIALVKGRLWVVGLRFYLDRRAETTGPIDDSQPLESLRTRLHLQDPSGYTPPDPINTVDSWIFDNMTLTYSQTLAIPAGTPILFPAINMPNGGNLSVTVTNGDAAHDDLTVSTWDEFTVANDGNPYPNTAASTGFGTIAHGTSKGYKDSNCAFQQVQLTLLSATGVSSATITASITRA